MKSLIISSLMLILLSGSLNLQAQSFYLASNGVTCMCPDAEVGESGTIVINGVERTFTKRTKEQITPENAAITCTSGITDMSELFKDQADFNEDISHWDVSSVTNMVGIFRGTAFNQPIENWDVGSVENMDLMFMGSSFNQAIEKWDVSSVKRMEGMFWDSQFNQPLHDWDVSNVTTMEGIFRNSPFNQPLENWNMSKVVSTGNMFNGTPFNYPIENWDVSNVENMWYMFSGSSFNQPLANWNVGKVKNMGSMFMGSSFNQPIGNWDVSNVENMTAMFDGSQFNQKIQDWDVSSVISMNSMFGSSSYNQPLGRWNVMNVTNMALMFAGTPFNYSIADWDVSSVDTMEGMFRFSSFNQPLEDWDVSKVENMNSMFFSATSFNQDLSKWCVRNLIVMPDNFSAGSPLQQSFMPQWGTCPSPFSLPEFLPSEGLVAWYPFNGNAKDESGNGNNGNINGEGIELSNDRLNNINSAYLFDGSNSSINVASSESLKLNQEITVSAWFQMTGTSDVSCCAADIISRNRDAYSQSFALRVFLGDNTIQFTLNGTGTNEENRIGLSSTTVVELSKWYHVTVSYDGNFLKMYVNGKLENTLASTVDFKSEIEDILIGKQKGDGNKLHYYLWNGALDDIGVWNRALTDEEIAALYVVKEQDQKFFLANNGITCMCPDAEVGESGTIVINGEERTFTKRTKEQITPENASSTCTSGITDMSELFKDQADFNEDISHWDVSSVTNMAGIFRGTAFNRPIENWDVRSVENMDLMFMSSSFNQAIEKWDVSSVKRMEGMFWDSQFNQPLYDWDVSNVTTMEGIFRNSPFNQPLENWNMSKVVSTGNMFNGTPFNYPIENWDVSNVENMWYMFSGSSFNQPLANWDIGRVKNMSSMFMGSSFNQPIGNWDVSNVENMTAMFKGSQFNQDIQNWDVSNVIGMNSMFNYSAFNQPLSAWDVGNVRDMAWMFFGTPFNQPIENWDVAKVTTMENMFRQSAFNQAIGKWNVSIVENMNGMFLGATSFNQDLSNWCVRIIDSEPENFSTNSPLSNDNKPKWGSCPGLFSLPPNLPAAGLVAWYPLNGNANDESGYSNDGVVNGALLTQNAFGQSNSGYLFDGSGTNIQFNEPFLGGGQVNEFSLSVRVKFDDLSNTPNIWGKTKFWGEVNLEAHADGSFKLIWANSITGNKYSVLSSDAGLLKIGEWYDLAIVFKMGLGQLYLNGVPIKTNMSWIAQGGGVLSTTKVEDFINFDQDPNSSKTAVRITSGRPGNYLNGVIDDFGIWNRALTIEEITAFSLKNLPEPPSVDSTPPVLESLNAPSTYVQSSTSEYLINVQLTDDSFIDTLMVFHKPIRSLSSADWQATPNAATGDARVFEGQLALPNAAFDELGTMFYLYAVDNNDNVLTTDTMYVYRAYSRGNPLSLQTPDVGVSSANFFLFGVPLELNPNSVGEVIAPAFGGFNNRLWRMFYGNGAQNIEVSASTPVETGEGYWMISAIQRTLNFEGTVPQVRVDSTFQWTLNAGWNLLANPYPFALNWNHLSLENAQSMEGISNPLGFNQGYQEREELDTFEGFYVFATEAQAIQVPVHAALNGMRLESKPALWTQNNWYLDLHVQGEDTSFDLAGLGMHTAAEENYDALDMPLVPRLPNYLDLQFTTKKILGIPLMRDVVPQGDTYTWDLRIEAQQSGTYTLSWTGINLEEIKGDIYLLDEATGQTINMRNATSYGIEEVHGSYPLKVLYSQEEIQADQPGSLGWYVSQAYPNPSALETSISYHVPDAGHQVRIELFDASGQRMGILKEEWHDAGSYSERIATANLSKGIYLVRFTLGTGTNTRQITRKLLVSGY